MYLRFVSARKRATYGHHNQSCTNVCTYFVTEKETRVLIEAGEEGIAADTGAGELGYLH
jgi:hypothetical protein